MEKMEGCPFCGGTVTVWDTGFGVVRVIECSHCKTRFVFPWNRTGDDLFKFWNARTQASGKETVK